MEPWSFAWPAMLWALLLLPALAAAYLLVVRRPAREWVMHSQATLAEAAARRARRRHLPASLFGLGVLAALVALARPIVPWPAPTGWPVVLVIDVSRSMTETDVAPTRLDAAKAAASEFVRGLPRTTRAALVTFGNRATVVVPPTADRDRLLGAIDGLSPQLRTQLGNGLVEGVRAIAGEGAAPTGTGPGAVAVLLSDGRASDGISPQEAAQEARARRVRVYTVGLGTAADPSQFRSGYWGVLDEPTLRMIAEETGGRYYRASSASGLRGIYRDLARAVGWTSRPEEASALAALGALALLVAAFALVARVAPLA